MKNPEFDLNSFQHGVIEKDANQLANYSDLLAGDVRYYRLCNNEFIDVM